MVRQRLSSDDAAIENLRRDLALQLFRAVKQWGLTQSAAAKRLKLPQPTLSKIINGQTDKLSIEFLIRAGVRAGLSLTLFSGDDVDQAGAFVTLRDAPSSAAGSARVGNASRADTESANSRLTTSQRLEAFLEHNERLAELRRAGRSAGRISTSRPGQSALLLVDVVETLRRAQVDYLVIGAFALAAHGIVRASIDADVLLQTTLSKMKQLRRVFEGAGLEAELRQGRGDDPIPAMLVVRDLHGNRVDLLGGLRGLDLQVFARATEAKFRDGVLRFVGLEDFIAMKCFAQGPQHLLDARAAYRAADGPVDLDLLRRVAHRFGRDSADRLDRIL
jgi:predicted XRE-type DNA-binding protein